MNNTRHTRHTPSLTVVLATCALALPAAAGAPPGTVPRTTLLRVLTDTHLTVEYSRTPAREVFKHLQNTLGIPIIGRYSDDKAGHGIEPDTPITLDVAGMPAVAVLRLVLDQCQDIDPCTWQLRRGYVEVGTKERLSAAAAQEIRVYPIADFLMVVPDFNNAPGIDLSAALNQAGAGGGGGGSGGGGGGTIITSPGEGPRRVDHFDFVQELIDLIRTTVEPDAWDTVGGEASINYLSGNLIVRAPEFIHRRLGGPERVAGTRTRSGRLTP